MTNQCVISAGIDRHYPPLLDRQRKAMQLTRQSCAYLSYRQEYPPQSPTHQQVMYAFKAYALKEAERQGYRQLLWIDAAVWPIRSLDGVFQQITERGYLFIKNGWNTGVWCCDSALEPLGLTRENSFTYPHLMSCAFGLNLDYGPAKEFLDEFYRLAVDGKAFNGNHRNDQHQCSQDSRVLGHRHDQTVASVLAWRLGMRDWRDKTTASPMVYWNQGEPIPEHISLLSKGGEPDRFDLRLTIR